MSELKDAAAIQYILGPDPVGSVEYPAMPLGRTHLIGGGSGTGKSTLLFQLLAAAYRGEDFLGYPTQWHPTVYVAFDRRVDEQEETMRRAGLDPTVLPHYYYKVPLPPHDRSKPDHRLENIVNEVIYAHPETKVLLLDAFYILASYGDMNHYVTMAEWLQRVGDIAHSRQMAIIGIVHSAKQREGSRITDPRYSITGSVATGGFTSCQVIVEQPDPEKAPEKRLVHVYPRNAASHCFAMQMDERGQLQIDHQEAEDAKLYLEMGILAKAEAPMVLGDIVAGMSRVKCSLATTKRYLKALVDEGRVRKHGRGLYELVKDPVAATEPTDAPPWGTL